MIKVRDGREIRGWLRPECNSAHRERTWDYFSVSATRDSKSESLTVSPQRLA